MILKDPWQWPCLAVVGYFLKTYNLHSPTPSFYLLSWNMNSILLLSELLGLIETYQLPSQPILKLCSFSFLSYWSRVHDMLSHPLQEKVKTKEKKTLTTSYFSLLTTSSKEKTLIIYAWGCNPTIYSLNANPLTFPNP